MNLKGDSLQFEISFPQSIQDWKIRASLYDKYGNNIKLATSNSGGSDDQIKKTLIGTSSSKFVIYVPSNITNNWDDVIDLEIKIDTGEVVGGVERIVGKKIQNINLLNSEIDWTDPNA